MRRLAWSVATLALLAALGARWARHERGPPPRILERTTGTPHQPEAGPPDGLEGATGNAAQAPAPPDAAPAGTDPAAATTGADRPSADPVARGSPGTAGKQGAAMRTEVGLASSAGDDGCGSSPEPASAPAPGPQPGIAMAGSPRPLDVLGQLEGGWMSASASSLSYHRDEDGLIELPGHPGAEGQAVVRYGEDGTGMWRGMIDGSGVLEHILFDRVEELASPPGARRVVFRRDGPGPVDSIELELDGKDALLWSVTRNGQIVTVRYWRRGP